MIGIHEVITGKTYRIQGDMENGWWDGKPVVHANEITRPISRIGDSKIYCRCGRVFLINDNLKIEKVSYENY